MKQTSVFIVRKTALNLKTNIVKLIKIKNIKSVKKIRLYLSYKNVEVKFEVIKGR